MDDYPDLLKEYLNFCNSREQGKQNGLIDFSNIGWVYPTEILPLVAFILGNKNLKFVYPENLSIRTYLNKILQQGNLAYSSGTYMPIVALPKLRKEASFVIERLQRICDNGKNLGGTQAFFYFISEMIDNIYEHSNFSKAYVFAQTYPKKEFSEVAIIDDGISIPGNYAKAGYDFKDDDALLNAVKGVSTKDKERGFGLRTSISLLTQGLNGQFLIVSRGASLYVNESDKKVFKLQNQQSLQGTLVSVRLPYPAKEVNIYEYI